MRKQPGFRAALFLLASACWVNATPSGLNNIPTADTTPRGTFVFQLFSTAGNNRNTDLNYGFKTGFDLNFLRLELGSAGHLYPGKSGPATFHSKIAAPLGDYLPTIGVGVANGALTEPERNRAGDPFAYAVLSEELKLFRLLAGVGYQDSVDVSDAQPFFGFDKTFKIKRERIAITREDGKDRQTTNTSEIADGRGPGSGDPNAALETRDLFTFRSDAIRQHNEDWLYSAGVLVPLCKTSFSKPGAISPRTATPPSPLRATSC